jgi:hypothetical protein
MKKPFENRGGKKSWNRKNTERRVKTQNWNYSKIYNYNTQ